MVWGSRGRRMGVEGMTTAMMRWPLQLDPAGKRKKVGRKPPFFRADRGEENRGDDSFKQKKKMAFSEFLIVLGHLFVGAGRHVPFGSNRYCAWRSAERKTA